MIYQIIIIILIKQVHQSHILDSMVQEASIDKVDIKSNLANIFSSINVGFLRSEFIADNGKTGGVINGQAVFISPNLILTTAQNVYAKNLKKKYPIKCTLSIKQNNKQLSINIQKIQIPEGYMNQSNENNDEKDKLNYALLTIDLKYQINERQCNLFKQNLKVDQQIFLISCQTDTEAKEKQKDSQKSLKNLMSIQKTIIREKNELIYYSSVEGVVSSGCPVVARNDKSQFEVAAIHKGDSVSEEGSLSYAIPIHTMAELAKWIQQSNHISEHNKPNNSSSLFSNTIEKWKPQLHLAVNLFEKLRDAEFFIIYNLFQKQFPSGQFQIALKYWMDKEPESYLPFFLFSIFLIQKGETQENIKCLLQITKMILDLNPHLSRIHKDMGYCHHKLGELDEAEKCYERCIQLNKRCYYAYNNLGVLLFEKKRYDQSLEWSIKSLEFNSEFEQAFNNLSRIFKIKEYSDRGIQFYKEIIAKTPKHNHAYDRLAQIYRERENFDQAIKWKKAFLEISPQANHRDTYWGLGLCYYNKKQFQEAINWYNKCLEIDPSQKLIDFNIGQCYYYLNDYQSALTYYLKEVSLIGESEIFLSQIAKSYEKLGDIENAKKYLNKCMSLEKGKSIH